MMKLHQIYSNRWRPLLLGIYVVIWPLGHTKERTRRASTRKSVERSVARIQNGGGHETLEKHAFAQFSVQVFVRVIRGF